MGQGASTATSAGYDAWRRTASNEAVASDTGPPDLEAPDVDVPDVEVRVPLDTKSKDNSGMYLPKHASITSPLVAICQLEGHSTDSFSLFSLDQLGVARTYTDGKERIIWRLDERDMYAPIHTGATRVGAVWVSEEQPLPASDTCINESVVRCCSFAEGSVITGSHSPPLAVAWESGQVCLVSSGTGMQVGHRGFMCGDLLVDDICICDGTR
jgi:hypothetical protein